MLRKLSRPAVTDRWFDVSFAIKYFIFGVFGVVGFFTSVPAIAEIGGSLYEFLWTFSIAVMGFAAAALVFKNVHGNYSRLRLVQWEWYATILLTGLVLTYSAALLILSIQGYERRFSLSIISLALLVFPVFRIRYLYRFLRGKTL